MPGLFSSVFDSAQNSDGGIGITPGVNLIGDDNGGDTAAPQTGTTDASQTPDAGGTGESGYGTSGENSLGGQLDLNPSVSLGIETSGEYQGLDGTTHGWSTSNDINLNADVSAVLGATSGYNSETFEG